MPAAGGELEVRARARDREEHAVVAVVIAEAADLGQPEAVAVERDDLVQALGVPGDAQLRPGVVSRIGAPEYDRRCGLRRGLADRIRELDQRRARGDRAEDVGGLAFLLGGNMAITASGRWG